MKKTLLLSTLLLFCIISSMPREVRAYRFNSAIFYSDRDSFIVNGTGYENTTHGTAFNMIASNSTALPPNQYYSYVHFDLSAISANFVRFTEIMLKVKPINIVHNGTVYVVGSSSNWTEGTLDWLNAPPRNNTHYDDLLIATPTITRFNVTDSGNFVKNGNFSYTYVLQIMRDFDPATIDFDTRETGSAYMPTLEVEYYDSLTPTSKPSDGFTIINLPQWMGYSLGLDIFLGGLILTVIFNMAFLFPVVKFTRNTTILFVIGIGLNTVFYFIGWLSVWVWLILLISFIIYLGRKAFGW